MKIKIKILLAIISSIFFFVQSSSSFADDTALSSGEMAGLVGAGVGLGAAAIGTAWAISHNNKAKCNPQAAPQP